MREVTKEEFKRLYFELGGGLRTGWSADYWDLFFEKQKRPNMKYLAQEPETRDHNRMMIVTDFGNNEYRMFFVTEEDEERMFDYPGKE